ncbi:MAG: hypothetical protein IKR48_00955 [Kiritimatiellae bacterium]|nr:hypothetical protein [Kiritimatiellia bacterium]
METTERKLGFFNRLYRGISHPITTFLFGVLLPAATVSLEMCTGMCSEVSDCNLRSSVALCLAMIAVPVCNLIVWFCLLKGRGTKSWILRTLCGFSFGIAVVYAIAFLPFMVLGAIGFCLLFWYFGIGFLGILPSGPFFATLAALGFKRGLNRKAEAEGCPKVKGFAWGVVAAGVVWVIAAVNQVGLIYAMRCAVSDDSAVSAKGVRLLRSVTNDTTLWRELQGYGHAPWWLNPLTLISSFYPGNISSEKRRLIYYRVTGEDPETMDMWGRGRRGGLTWDAFVGGEKMGGVLDGLSLKGSSYSTVVDAPGCVGYAEWTFVFSNDSSRNQEARARIALPPGGVVSRLTLWINGEEREAAFGTKGQVRQAYQKVVRRQRDPVLVNVCGPDQVQMQCFPVPPKGEMKVRLGITMPLALSDDSKSARLPAPALLTKNFSIPGDLLGMPTDETKPLETPPAATAVYQDDKFAPLGGRAVVQRAVRAPGWKPKRVAVVMDSSMRMGDFFKVAVESAFSTIPKDLPVELWIVRDEPPKDPAVSSPANDPGRADAFRKAIDPKDCAGGRCNLVTLVKAIDSLAKDAEPAALVWIHAAQPVVSQTADVLSAKINSAPNVRVFLCQVESGTCEITASLASTPNVFSCTSSALNGEAYAAVANIFAKWGQETWQTTRSNVAATEVPADSVKAGRHLGRLWAAEETLRTYRVGDPTSLEKAQKIALPWQIVTPVTGAVVLETAEQYKENDLKPADADSVPTTNKSFLSTVPEPGSICCLLLAVLVLVLALVFRARKARA